MIVTATPPGFRPHIYEYCHQGRQARLHGKALLRRCPGFSKLMETNKLAEAKGLKVGVGLQRRHDSGYLRRRSRRSRTAGTASFMFSRVYWNGGGIWFRDRSPQQTEMEYQVNNWYHFCWLSRRQYLRAARP